MESGFGEGKAEFNSSYYTSGIRHWQQEGGNYVFETHNVSQHIHYSYTKELKWKPNDNERAKKRKIERN